MFYARAPSREWAGGREATGLGTISYFIQRRTTIQRKIGTCICDISL